MKWIGLTGGMGTGKSSVAGILRARGFSVIDADELARVVVKRGSEGLAEIVATFGHGVLTQDGTLDRKKLGNKVFNNPLLLERLESILHPRIRKLAEFERKELAKAGHALAFYDVPLLFEKKMEELFDSIVVVACDRATQIRRVISRDGISEKEVQNRLKAQIDIERKIEKADYVIQNDKGLGELEQSVDELLKKLNYQPHA